MRKLEKINKEIERIAAKEPGKLFSYYLKKAREKVDKSINMKKV